MEAGGVGRWGAPRCESMEDVGVVYEDGSLLQEQFADGCWMMAASWLMVGWLSGCGVDEERELRLRSLANPFCVSSCLR